ncbi:twin-arginine translocation signal domain-containing protein [Nocardiopsis oceani]
MTEQVDRGGQSPASKDINRRTLLRACGVLGAAGVLGATGTPAYGTGRPDNWLYPGDDGYDGAVAGFNTTVTRRPEAVVLARSAQDVQKAVRYAGRHDLPVCVMATGHQA